jgi:hypothetical protein
MSRATTGRDGGRILEIGNFYASPKATSPSDRVVPIDVDEAWEHLHSTGVLFDFETTWGPNMFVPQGVPTWQDCREAEKDR